MRVRHFGVVMVAVTVAAFVAAHGFASSTAPGFNVPVKITNKGCTLGYTVVSRQYTRIVFGVFNNGTVAHGFDISGKYKSGLIKPHQERTLTTNLRPGGYRWACVAAHSTVKRGTFTIR
jgi:hypothetical protein